MASDALVQARIGHDVMRWVKGQARAEGVSVAQWVRTLILEKRAETLPAPPDSSIVRIMHAVEKIAAKCEKTP